MPRTRLRQRASAAGLAFSPDPEQRYLYVANRSQAQIIVFNRKPPSSSMDLDRGSGTGQFAFFPARTLNSLRFHFDVVILVATSGRNLNFSEPDFGFVWDYSRDQNSNCVLNLKRRPPIVSYGVNHCKP